MASLGEPTASGGCSGHLCPPQSESEQEYPVPQVVRSENIDDIDVLFEINHAETVECESSTGTTPESLHLALPSTSSETEQSPQSRDDVQVIPNNVEKLTSPCRTPSNVVGNAGLVIPDGVESVPMAISSTNFTVLQPGDKVEELESNVLELMSPTKSPSKEEREVGIPEAQAGSEGCEIPEVIKIEDDDTADSVESSRRSGVVPPSHDLPPSASFPTETRLARPTAVVNPFGAHEESCSISTDACERNIPEMPPSTFLPIPGSSQSTASQRSEQDSPITAASASLGGDLIAVIQDNGDSDTDSDVATPGLSSADPLRECRTPPHALGDVEMELGENWQNRATSAVSHELPDLSRLTPSKIAAFMNKDVFSAKHQSDIQKQLEEKAKSGRPLPISKEPARASSNEWEADSEGSRMSSEMRQNSMSPKPHSDDSEHPFVNSRSATQPSLSSEEDESLPFGFNIVSVESLLPNPPVPDQVENSKDVRQSARVRKNAKQPCEEAGKRPEDMTRKRTLSNNAGGDAEAATSSTTKQTEEHEHSPTRRKRTKSDGHLPGQAQTTSTGSNEVFKEPFGLVQGRSASLLFFLHLSSLHRELLRYSSFDRMTV